MKNKKYDFDGKFRKLVNAIDFLLVRFNIGLLVSLSLKALLLIYIAIGAVYKIGWLLSSLICLLACLVLTCVILAVKFYYIRRYKETKNYWKEFFEDDDDDDDQGTLIPIQPQVSPSPA